MIQMKSIFVLIFIIGLSFASSIDQTRLTGIQARNVYNLAKDNKVGLVFEFRQVSNSFGVLFRLRNDHHTVLLMISDKNETSTTSLLFQIGPQIFGAHSVQFDEAFHRVNLQLLNGHFQLIVDCVQVVNGSYEWEPSEGAHHNNPKIEIGFGDNYNKPFPGQIREFSVDLPQASDLKCSEVKIDKNARINRASASIQEENEVDELINQVGQAEALTGQNGQNHLSTNVNNNELNQRLIYIESQSNSLRGLLQSMDNRLKMVELHQRGCILNGKRVLSFGEKHKNLKECAECQCSVSGQLHCGPIGCPHLKCLHPIKVEGECCPQCGKQCFYNQVHYEHGVEIWPKSCVRCRCQDGRMECKFHKAEHCPQLACAHQEIPPNQCCPVCKNLNYCQPITNPCNVNAICENREFGAKCTCRQGFFGNGTSCYDIDECLWDDSAREQLGGCQAGTICINLPGAFKCDCLPGFQRLDDRNCLDIIRI